MGDEIIWAPDMSPENLARGKAIEYKVAGILNALFLDCRVEKDGLLARVVQGKANEEDVFVDFFDYEKNKPVIKAFCQIEIEEKPTVSFDNEKWPWRQHSLLGRKVDNRRKYVDTDIYLMVPCKAEPQDVCRWWIFGDVRKAIESNEYRTENVTKNYREKYYRRPADEDDCVYKGYGRLINYLLDILVIQNEKH